MWLNIKRACHYSVYINIYGVHTKIVAKNYTRCPCFIHEHLGTDPYFLSNNNLSGGKTCYSDQRDDRSWTSTALLGGINTRAVFFPACLGPT